MTEPVLPIKSAENIDLIRNFGLVSHVNTGKTTTAEKMLFYAKAISLPGSVDNGTTVMDYMEQERKRGITIRPSLITFAWDGYQFNMIDAPGQVDFNAEIERTLSVLDGAIVCFDAVEGVQARIESVWRLANQFKVPRIVYVNKMDKTGASLEDCIGNLTQQLRTDPFVMQIPYFSHNSEEFLGCIDLLTQKKIVWDNDYGEKFSYENISREDPLFKTTQIHRNKLIEKIALYDKKVSNENVDPRQLEKSIKQILLKHPRETCALYLGSSLKNKGVQPLLDGIVKYLPSPLERAPFRATNLTEKKDIQIYPKKDDSLSAFAFKVVHDIHKGPLTYVRVCSGTLNNRCHLYNVSKDVNERSAQIYRVRANEYVEVQSLEAGDLGAIAGLSETVIGDTLIDQKDKNRITINMETTTSPVYAVSIEYESIKDKTKFDHACSILTREDPSLSVEENKTTGQIVVYGLGMLQIEIFRERLESEFGVKTTIGKMQVSYKESISQEAQKSFIFSEVIYGQPLYAHVELKIEPAVAEDFFDQNENPDESNKVFLGENVLLFDFGQDTEFMKMYNEYKRRIKKKKVSSSEERIDRVENGKDLEFQYIPVIDPHPDHFEAAVDDFGHHHLSPLRHAPFENIYGVELALENALAKGPLLGSPIYHAKVTLTGGKFSNERSNHCAFEMCTAELVKGLLEEAEPVIFEPVMDLQISTPTKIVNEIIHDILANRRGNIVKLEDETKPQSNGKTFVQATIPLEVMLDYSSYLRSFTHGEAEFTMKFKQFEKTSETKQKEILESNI